MRRKLDILVPQYKETDEIVKPLLDSIAVQQNVDFNEIGVIICNDGTDVRLSDELLHSYPFTVEYYLCEHRGVSATRNACLDKSEADYVMFADADDCFCNSLGLFIVFREMGINGGFDTLVSSFIEETRNPQTKEVLYVPHEVDSTFVHGKVHRRKYLINNNIRWNESLTVHEDSYFNILCQRLLSDSNRGRYCPTPFYLWKWRDESVCRHDPLYLNKTYTNMLDSNSALIREFLDRGREKDAVFYVTAMIYDSYYSINCDRWWNDEGKEFLPKTMERMKEYWKDFKYLFEKMSKGEQLQIASGIRQRFFNEGLLHEKMTFDEWISKLEE